MSDYLLRPLKEIRLDVTVCNELCDRAEKLRIALASRLPEGDTNYPAVHA